MDNSFSSLISAARSVLVVLPTKPYLDQVAAGLSIYLSLREQKKVSIHCPSSMTVEFNRLVGVNQITSDVGNKNLTIRFKNYDANNIEKVSYDIENGEFKLTIVTKPGLMAPTNDQIDLSFSGVAADTAILVGGGNINHFPILSTPDFNSSKLIHIGTRVLGSMGEKSVLSFARPASSVSEIAADLIKQSGLSIDPDIATNLIAGIEEGSKGFKSDEVGPETFEILASLMRSGGKRLLVQDVSKNFPPGVVPGQPVSFYDPKGANYDPKVAKFEPVSKDAVQTNKGTSEDVQEKDSQDEPPKDWLEPKIYKGTSVS